MHRSMALITLCVLTAVCCLAQDGTISTIAGAGTAAVSTNKMTFRTLTYVCGGKVQAGTPITALGAANDQGTITISGIPATATVHRADLFWTVLTNEPTTATLGQEITLNGAPVTGFKIGAAEESPCFPQDNTIAYRSIVTGLVTSPGNGTYTVAGLPTSPHFSEGVTLQIAWSDPNGPLMEDNLYHAMGDTPGTLAVTLGEAFSQDMALFGTNATGTITAKLYEVIGNGQAASEVMTFAGPCSNLNLNNTLDGSTVAKAAGTCPLSPVAPPQCFWDDDVWIVSPQFACPAGNGATTANLSVAQPGTSDCFDYPALSMQTSTDQASVCAAGGIYVDNQCPLTNEYKNHGDYVSCVAQAAERFLAGLPYGGTCPREEIQSCIVSPRASKNK